MPVYFYDPPERFVAGAVGQPGERIFYLQATSSGITVETPRGLIQVMEPSAYARHFGVAPTFPK